MSEQQASWWRNGVIYQIYPRSFQDSNHDGVGDLDGITSRLDYLAGLGIHGVWVSPIYPSPMADFGYDVADYVGIDPLFGNMAGFDTMLDAVHARGMKLILDFVPNHTSDRHPWFLSSCSSRTDPKRDWYLWRDPAPDGGAPNNWMSNFGGTGWTLDEASGQYFYHSFLPQQPDLNWRNPAVRKAMFDSMRFWLDKGVDGFRMDVIWLLIKDDQFRSNLPNPDYRPGPESSTFWSLLPTWTADQPETHEIVQQMRALMDTYPDRVLIGEIYLPVPELVRYYEPVGDGPATVLRGAQMPFNFHLIQTDWQADALANLIRQYEAALPDGAWPNWVMGNHDQHRIVTRIGPDQARVAAMLLLTLRGTPTMYYGDELGMPDAVIAPDEVVDPAEKRQPGRGFGRDGERSPMLWSNAANAGFTSPETRTWLPLVQGWPAHTVESAGYHADSMLALYRRLLALRQSTPALHMGTIENVTAENGVLAYTRTDGTDRYEIHLNLTAEPQITHASHGKLVLTSFLDQTHADVGGTLGLRANEAIILHIVLPIS